MRNIKHIIKYLFSKHYRHRFKIIKAGRSLGMSTIKYNPYE